MSVLNAAAQLSTPAADATRPRSGLRRGASTWSLVAFFALVFAATTLALRHLLPGGSGLDRNEIKLERFREHKDEYTLLFFGSSRAHRGFVPSLFDQRMRERGLPTRSFNFGVPGARSVEMQHLLARVAELAPRGLDYVLIDPEGFSVVVDDRNALARSVIDWHDPRITLLISRYVLGLDVTEREKAELLAAHWRSCLYNVTNVGRALRWVDGALGVEPGPDRVAEQLGPQGDGYAPLGAEGEELGRRGRNFQKKKRDEYLAAVEELRTTELSPGPPDPTAVELFHLLCERIEALGATPVFVTQPAMYLQDDLVKSERTRDVPHLLRFDGPDRYPELYLPENRYDQTHLNDDGARLFTELLAREFAAALERGEIRRP